jgi:S-adenosylmethionine-diacylglycerol 3-amino-3-carboxypropyl transferase
MPGASSQLQFAVVREDPRLESALVRELHPRRALLVASGGCTALHLRAEAPELAITLVEPNPAQLAHVQRKLAELGSGRTPANAPSRWNIGTADPTGLHECGHFERLFRLFRNVLDLFVLPAAERAQRCADPAADWADVVRHQYWPVAFATAFGDELLLAMFGPAAIQHAPRGSYPGYFRRRIESALSAGDRHQNPWLHHVLLGHHLTDAAAWPPFLQNAPADLRPFDSLPCDLASVPSFAPFDFVGLSNVLDWMDDAACRQLAERLGAELRPGAAVLWRQLNDPRPLGDLFAPTITCDPFRDALLTERERSFFYDQVHLGTHRGK